MQDRLWKIHEFVTILPSDFAIIRKEITFRKGMFLMDDIMTPTLLNQQENLLAFATRYQQLMLLYEGGIKQITTKLDILNREYHISGQRTPIETIKSRLKTPKSIAGKLKRKHFPITIDSIVENLNDVAGVRVICPYISDIYTVRNLLVNQADVVLCREKDYIKNPKPNGYRSLHLVLQVPVYLSDGVENVRVEVQIRTIAMDFWASLEHELHYKTDGVVPPGIAEELAGCAAVIAETDRRMESIAVRLNQLSADFQEPSLGAP